jgi:hypothetical protein
MVRLAHIILCFHLLYFMFDFNKDVIVDCDIPSGSPLPFSPPPCPNLLEWNRQNFNRRNYRYKGQNLISKKHEIKINCYDAFQISVISIGVIILLRLSLLHLCTHVSFVTFNTDLNLYSKKKTLLVSTQRISTYLSLNAGRALIK